MRHLPATAAALLLALSVPGHGETARHDHAHTHDHDHDHDHAQDAAPAQDDAIYRGYFDDAQVADRPLSDWQGDWRSVYPLLVSGALDPVMAHKAKTGDKTAAEYRAYYDTGYTTDTDRIVIEGDTVTFHRGDKAVSATYAGDGYAILTYPKGNRGVRFIFEKTAGDAGAPRFIQFSDHRIAPSKSDHYHLYWGDDRAALLDELTHWPTYYPASLSDEQIVAEMLAH